MSEGGGADGAEAEGGRGRPSGSGEGPAAEDGPAAVLDALPSGEAAEALRSCCASERWVERMAALRPFGDDERLFADAERVWWELDPEDWREAFAAHPRIGERDASPAGEGEGPAGDWSREEQSGVERSAAETRLALAEGNRAYEERFGHVFLIFAPGRSGEEMLAELRRRMDNDPEEELRVAAGEQARITRHRLEKLPDEYGD